MINYDHQLESKHSIIPQETFLRTFKHHKRDNFIKFLVQEHGEKLTASVVKRFNIGLATNGLILWYQDMNMKFRTGQIIKASLNDGSFISADDELVHEKYARINNLKFTYEGCVFGEHQLMETLFLPKGLVTNPTLAIVLSILIPEIYWFSPPVRHPFNIHEFISRFREAPFYIFPDTDNVQDWDKSLKGTDPNLYILTDQLVDLYPKVLTFGLKKNSEHMMTLVSRVQSLISNSK